MQPSEDPAVWTETRNELRAWFSERAPSLLDGYVAAVTLLRQRSFPARVHLICHVVRDIYTHLPGVLGDPEVRVRPNDVYPGLVTKLRKELEKLPPREHNPGQDDGILVSHSFFRTTEELAARNIELERQPRTGTHLCRALYRATDRPINDGALGKTYQQFESEYKYFVKRAHLVKAVEKAHSDHDLVKHFESFELGLSSIVGSYFKHKDVLDAILQETNRRTD
jgi:hypothetical protein